MKPGKEKSTREDGVRKHVEKNPKSKTDKEGQTTEKESRVRELIKNMKSSSFQFDAVQLVRHYETVCQVMFPHTRGQMHKTLWRLNRHSQKQKHCFCQIFKPVHCSVMDLNH